MSRAKAERPRVILHRSKVRDEASVLRQALTSTRSVTASDTSRVWSVACLDLVTQLRENLERGVEPSAALDEAERVLRVCDCPASNVTDTHTVAEHEADSCGGQTFDPPCGGCYSCVSAQVSYGESRA